MNIYICSTVRHLLFALLKAAHSPNDDHNIVYFSDYQAAPLDDWNLSDIPDNIEVHEMNRRAFAADLRSTIGGRIFYRLSMLYLPPSRRLKKHFLSVAGRHGLGFMHDAKRENERLWLFNERNKMARLFRAIYPDFSVIEDGDATYHSYRLSLWKSFGRRLLRLPSGQRAFGDSPHCKTVWAIYPERLPHQTRAKGQRIDFLDTPTTKSLVAGIFGSLTDAIQTQHSAILATQPIDGVPGVTLSDKQRIYRQITDYLLGAGWTVTLKVHPKENFSDYEELAAECVVAPAKIPLEAFVLGSPTPLPLISVASTAGLGLEHLCRRIRLAQGDYADTVRLWAGSPEMLHSSLQQQLARLSHI